MANHPLVLLRREGRGVVPRSRSLDGNLSARRTARQHQHFHAAARGSSLLVEMIDRLFSGASRHSTQRRGVDILSNELHMAIGERERCATGVRGAKLKLAFAAILARAHFGIDAGLRAGRTTFPPANYTALKP